jgi:hypothetical protein
MQKRSPASIAALFAVGAVVALALCLVAAAAVLLVSMRGPRAQTAAPDNAGAELQPTRLARTATIAQPVATTAPVVAIRSARILSDLAMEGTGDAVVAIQKTSGPALLIVSHDGDGLFTVETVDVNNRVSGALIITAGNYNGTVLIDADAGDSSARLKIKARGTWTIKMVELSNAPVLPVPGTLTFNGDGVFLVNGPMDTLTLAYESPGLFTVTSYQDNHRDSLVIESSFYKGTVLAPNGTRFIEIRASGPWTVVTTTR